jgi:hypothetical protein
MQTDIHSHSKLYNTVRWSMAAMALSAGLAATRALALVYQDTDAQSAGLAVAMPSSMARSALAPPYPPPFRLQRKLGWRRRLRPYRGALLMDESGKPIVTRVDVRLDRVRVYAAIEATRPLGRMADIPQCDPGFFEAPSPPFIWQIGRSADEQAHHTPEGVKPRGIIFPPL